MPECRNITERKSAEEQLHHQWQKFDIALSHTPDFTYTFDLDGRFAYVNKALLSLWEKPLRDALGKNFLELNYPPPLAERLQRQIQQVVKTKQPIRDDTPFTGPSGETRHYEYIFVPVLNANGEVKAIAGSTRDVTERAKAEEIVERDRRRWREILRQTPAAVALLHGPQHRLEWANDRYFRLIGRSAEALIGKTVLEALPEIAAQKYLALLDRVYQTGAPFTGTESLLQIDRGDGTLKDAYVNFVYLPARDVAGDVDGIFVHATDVTDMVLTRKRVEESERQFHTLAETIPHLAWMADETGYIFWYNRRWYEFTGTSLEEMEGWGWQKVHDPRVLPEVLEKWRTAIASGEPFDMIFPLRRADGEFRSFLTRVEPVKDDQGKVVRWFGTNTDVTAQRRTEEELRRMNRELEEFSYVAGHDLREPLRMLNLYTELLLKKLGGGDGECGIYANVIRQCVSRMDALLRDLLTFSHAVHSEELPGGTADLSASLNEALTMLHGQIAETGAIIEVEALPMVRGDTSQMAQVFQNLLSNAMKYRQQGVPVRITISVQPDGDRWTVSVKDNGIGFEPRYAEHIFGLFKRLHNREFPGTGLGLAICKRIVERYGGRIWAEAALGQGANFSVSLPRAT